MKAQFCEWLKDAETTAFVEALGDFHGLGRRKLVVELGEPVAFFL